jgi:hypothetical protein
MKLPRYNNIDIDKPRILQENAKNLVFRCLQIKLTVNDMSDLH